MVDSQTCIEQSGECDVLIKKKKRNILGKRNDLFLMHIMWAYYLH